jgi:tungstate transport system substrate-binding protein
MKTLLVTFLCLIALAGCRPKRSDVILATTTSTYDSGLLDVLGPRFEEESGYTLKTIAVGSGQAMAMGRRGEADVLLVHSPAAEEAFMDEGYGSRRRRVMHNDFVLLGPASDPAGIGATSSAADAFAALASKKALFVSRGDDSGTHAKERAVWKEAGIEPAGTWYLETGTGMGKTLAVTSEKQGHTLSDRGTYLALRKRLELGILSSGDAILHNVYHVIEVSAARFPDVNHEGAAAFADFLLSHDTQETIGTYGHEKFGMQLFAPDAGK